MLHLRKGACILDISTVIFDKSIESICAEKRAPWQERCPDSEQCRPNDVPLQKEALAFSSGRIIKIRLYRDVGASNDTARHSTIWMTICSSGVINIPGQVRAVIRPAWILPSAPSWRAILPKYVERNGGRIPCLRVSIRE